MIGTAGRMVMAAAIAVATLGAEDFWEKKKYSEWSEDQVRKLLTDSPWAKQVSIQMSLMTGMPGAGGRGGRGGGMSGGGMGGPGKGGPGMSGPGSGPGMGAGYPGGGMEGGPGGGGMPGGMGGGMPPGQMPQMTLIVRWQSALPVKEALAVARMGKEAESSQEAQQFLQRKESRYVVSVSGFPPMMGGQPAPGGQPPQNVQDREKQMRERFRSAATLRTKKKEPFLPEDVQVRFGRQGMELYFLFPRTAAISLEDDHVEFALKTEMIETKAKFKLKKMVLGGNLEL